MQRIIFLFALLVSLGLNAQSDALGKNYFEKGEYEKSLAVFNKLLKQYPHRNDYAVFVIKSHQQLEQFEEAEQLIQSRLERRNPPPTMYVELGFNFALQEKDSLARVNYDKALSLVTENPLSAYIVGRKFTEYSLLEDAVTTYETAMELDPLRDYRPQLARIYGEMGNIEKMFEKYIELIVSNSSYRASAQRTFSFYVNEDPNNEANQLLRKALLTKLQEEPNILFNELLSWLFIQQKEFRKAFIQEKAIYKRSEEDLGGIMDLLRIAIDEAYFEDAKDIAEFVIENAPSPPVRLEGYQYLMNVRLKLAKKEEYAEIQQQYLDLFTEFGYGVETLALQLDYNHFLAFMFGKSQLAIDQLKTLSQQNLSRFQEARVKLKLADILVFDEKFNQALIYYSQIQKKVSGDILAQEARFKVARTSYFKGDFEWAQIQLDVLRKSSSQLIANDAMELSLMIRDNSIEDTAQVALKKFARADLLALQQKNTEAITLINDILTNHKGEQIEDEALLKWGEIYEALQEPQLAANQYEKLIEFYAEDILADDAYYRLAKLYEGPLADTEKAKAYYEFILFNMADSIYFVEARKRYRMLRGDAIN